MFTDDIVADLNFKRTDAHSVDIAGHIDTLIRYGRNVDTITEFGVRRGTSTCCWLVAEPRKLTCYDIVPNCLPIRTKVIFEGFAKEKHIDFRFICGDSRKVEIEETDLLFIDTHHTYEQLSAELNRHGNKAGKYIICHDTVYDAGCLKAIKDYIVHNFHWRISEHFTHNNGLTVMERTGAAAVLKNTGNCTKKGCKNMKTGIVIHSAIYGVGAGREKDVTGVVAELVAAGSVSVTASNGNFGDPAPGLVKQLNVKYSVDSVNRNETVGENETITFIPNEATDKETEAEDAETDNDETCYDELGSCQE